MYTIKTYQKRNMLVVVLAVFAILICLLVRLSWLMLFQSEGYAKMAEEVQQRERTIKGARGQIYDRNGVVLATNQSVCTISVIYNQVTDPETVISALSEALGLSEDEVREKVEKYSSRERIKSNVPKEVGDYIKSLALDGVMVDEDYRRYYPLGTVASRVLGFTGADNQGIIGLEVAYDSLLQGQNGRILTLTTAHGLELDGAAEQRVEPIAGNDLYISMDYNIQMYCQQTAYNALSVTQAKTVSIVVMNPQNGELLAMTTVPEFDANDPYTLLPSVLEMQGDAVLSQEKRTELLNAMWRNPILSDTYEPGSTFKIVTTTAALEDHVVSLEESFFCPGYKLVEDRRIHCHKVAGHGSETFTEGIMNSCNPVFMEIGARVGAERMYYYFERLGLFSRTGIDLPGEANSIMHRLDAIGPVELATVSFGQSFQITPLQLMRAVSAAINGGTLVTPHFGVSAVSADGMTVREFSYNTIEGAISAETSETVRYLLEKVVSEGTGKRAYLPGFTIGGKTATSEKLPRSENKYIASFIGFAPAENPEVLALVLIDEPQGIYYGGTIAAPVIAEVFDNVLPYLGIERSIAESAEE